MLTTALGRTIDPRALTAMVSAQSRRYHGETVTLGPSDSLAARTLFFLPRDLVKLHRPVSELALAGMFTSRALDLLDLGAGVGASALGLLRALPKELSVRKLTAVDLDPEALAIFRRVYANAHGAGLVRPLADHTPVETTVRDLSQPGWSAGFDKYDIVCIGLALVEMSGPSSDENLRAEAIATVLREALSLVRDDGALVVIEPATRLECRSLHRARALLLSDGVTVFAPCLHARACPMLETDRDWCHDDEQTVSLPPWLVSIARQAGLRWEGPTYSYLTLRRDGRTLGEKVGAQGFVPARAISQPIVTKGKTELWCCGPLTDNVTGIKLFELDRHAKNTTEPLGSLSRGSLLRVSAETVASAEPGRALRVTPEGRERVR